ncbi:MAG: hypothetical protein KA716_26150 [Gloeotrichia echinulata DEX184]|nr:hypothetical protein [Gloeotrichia echinulata DEX184]
MQTDDKSIRLLDEREYPSVISMVERSEEANALLFFLSALRTSSDELKVYAEHRDDWVIGVVALLPSLPPFGVPVLLPAGTVSSALLCSIAKVERSPRMALGPLKPTTTLVEIWPTAWAPLIGRREEALLKQTSPPQITKHPEVLTRPAAHSDVETLIEYRIAMEKDSGTTITSTSAEARETVTALIDRQALTVVEVRGEIGGCAAISASDNRYEQIGFVYVEPQHRLLGVSDRLLSDVCLDIHARGKKPISFTAHSGPLFNRLHALSFEKIGEHLKLYFRS